MQEYLSSFHEHESAQSPAVQNYFYSRGLVDLVVDEITLSLNNNVKLDFQNFEKIRWHSIDGEWYQLEGLSFKDRYILLQSRHPLTNQDEEKLRQALLEIRNNAPIVDVFNDLINLERESFVTVLEFKKELRTLLEQIKDIEDNYIIRGKCELGY
jgi:hypothetical protein